MNNPFAVRFREAAFTLEETNIPEIAEMLHIAAREIDRLEDLLEKAQRPTGADMAKEITAQSPKVDIYSHPGCVFHYCGTPELCQSLPKGCQQL
jgi:hypothetical protein